MRVTFFVDGGFFKRKFKTVRGKFPTAKNVWDFCVTKILPLQEFTGDALFRIFFYDCRPYQGEVTDPRTGGIIDFGQSASAKAQEKFLNNLAALPHMAVRAGELAYRGLAVPPEKIVIANGEVTLKSEDLFHNFQQKQVDIKIGLDIAWVAQKGISEKIVLVAGDSDLIPAMKFARKEGVLVYLAHLGHSVRFDMIAHADGVIAEKI